jgi:signal transduction histidine kinase
VTVETRMNILVVEDDPMAINLLRLTLTQAGHEMVVANNGREALEILRSTSIRMVISDWEMPEMSGIELCRAIRSAEFGRAVGDERARVAREIHDGLAQYLFAVSTHASMLETGAPVEQIAPRLKEAASLAQQEARFAVLALSSASGNAPFDAALTRYVEFLTADGRLDVELEIDSGMALAPDEQIEVFRIVQEGLANVRRHAEARRAEVRIGQDAGRRFVHVRDDGHGFDPGAGGAGQGLKNISRRAESIHGAFSLQTRPGWGTALEVVLRS